MRLLLACCALSFACAHGGAAPDQRLSGWRAAHPAAAQELCSFARNYPSASTRVREWVREHPAQAEELLGWAAENPGSMAPEAFLQTHPGWNRYLPWRDPALYVLFDWATQNPDAARQLAGTPHGIERAIDGRC